MASSVVVNKPPSRRAPAAGRAGRATAVLGGVRRTTALLVLAAVVLSLNLVAGNGAAEERTASFSEIAQTDARASADELARMAQELSMAPGAARNLAAEFKGHADILTEQSALLTRPGSLRRGTPPFAVPASGSSTGVAAAEYIQALGASARSSFNAALRADGGTARLLASTGAAQQVLAIRAAEIAGLDAPAGWKPAAAVGAANRCPSDPEVSGTNGRTGSTSSSAVSRAASPTAESSQEPQDTPDAADALMGAIDAEYGAAYAYEVAMARSFSAATRTEFAEAREDHLAAGVRSVQLLPELCRPALTPAPAYSLPPSFANDAAEELMELESALPAVYADLAAFGEGAVRTWAIERLAELSADLYVKADPVPAAPGVDAEPPGLPWTADTT